MAIRCGSVLAGMAMALIGCVDTGAPGPSDHPALRRGAGNQPPAVTVNEVLVVPEGGSGLITSAELTAEDADNGPAELMFILDAVPLQGDVTRFGAPLGTGEVFTMADVDAQWVSYSHDGSETDHDGFTFRVSDPLGAEATADFLIEIEPVNDRPVALDDGPFELDQDTVLVVAAADGVLVNDTDVEGDGLVAVPSHGVVNGTLELDPDGGFTYAPFEGFHGRDRFVYVANDGAATSNTAGVVLVVYAVPDEPVDTGVMEDPTACGCAGNGLPAAPSAAWLVLAGLAAARRRTVRPCRSR